jgi:hypothetical protein
MDGYIYNYATPSNPAIDVTGYECPTCLTNRRCKR